MRAGSQTLAIRAGVVLGLALGADAAYAHAASPQAGSFYAGLLHPLTAPEHVLSMVALGLLAGQHGLNKGQGLLLVFPAAMALGAGLALRHPALGWVSLLNIGSVALFGGLVTATWRVPAALLYALALLFGMTHGYANGAAITPNLSPAVFNSGLGHCRAADAGLQHGRHCIPAAPETGLAAHRGARSRQLDHRCRHFGTWHDGSGPITESVRVGGSISALRPSIPGAVRCGETPAHRCGWRGGRAASRAAPRDSRPPCNSGRR